MRVKIVLIHLLKTGNLNQKVPDICGRQSVLHLPGMNFLLYTCDHNVRKVNRELSLKIVGWRNNHSSENSHFLQKWVLVEGIRNPP